MTDAEARLVARIDLDRLAGNWRELDRLSGDAECAAVVKANAYGHGMAPSSLALHHAGCRTFFTASADEAVELRSVLPDAAIGFFDGTTTTDPKTVAGNRIMPSVNSIEDLRTLGEWAEAGGGPVPAMLQLDTGMNRLGIGTDDLEEVVGSGALDAGDWKLVFSHLIDADRPDDPRSGEQKRRFDAMLGPLPSMPASLAATGGILLGKDYHYQMTRPGIGLYGLNPVLGVEADLQPVLSLHARILQIREAAAGETVGYGGTATLDRPSRLATVAGGYADGVRRQLSNLGHVHREGLTAPIIGRVSMDSTVVDITDWPKEHAYVGGYVDMIHDGFDADAMAERSGTIGYDVLTGLGLRAVAHYAGALAKELDLVGS